MFSTFFRFELRFWLTGMMAYVFTTIIALLVMGAASSDNVVIGGALDNTYRNAPFVVQSFYGVMGIICVVMVAAFINSAASRDFIYGTHQLIYTKPIDKLGFLMGRFWGATLVAVLPLLGVSVGMVIARYMPWAEAERFGPISFRAHLSSILAFAIPNTFFVSAILFAIAVWTRSTVASFVGAILLIVGYSIAGQMIGNLDNKNLAAMTDPFGMQAFSEITRYWTMSDKNTQVVGMQGILLANRALWTTVGMAILGLSCWRFNFAERHRRGKQSTEAKPVAAANINLPDVQFHHGFVSQIQRLASQISVDFWSTIRSNVFIVVMLTALAQTIASLYLTSSEGFGLATLPVTYQVVAIIRGASYVFLLAVITFYAGVLVWKERDASLDEVYDALPQPTWIAYIGKLIAMLLIVALVLAVGMAAGVAVQASKGYTRFQLALYLQELFTIDMPQMFFLTVLAFFAHVVSPNRYSGYFLFVALLIFNTFGWSVLKVETNMVDYGDLPGYIYSDMFQFAPFAKGMNWFTLYWTFFAGLVSVAAILFWQRGRETNFVARLASAKRRFNGPFSAVASLACICWIGCAVWVYYNTQVLNEYLHSETITSLRADYEKDFKASWDGRPQPRVTDIRYEIDLYPQQRKMVLRGEQTIVNRTDTPIEQLFISYDGDFENDIEIQNSSLAQDFPDMDVLIYKIDPPMMPGDTSTMSYCVSYEPVGFENSVSVRQIVQNGTFFNNSIVPQIGYQPRAEISDKRDRKKHDLGEPNVMPPLNPEDTINRSNSYLSSSSDWVNIETVISTSADQIAIGPGSLQESWQEGDRRYFRYQVDHPSVNFYSFISADYEVATQQWKDVDIEVYYHKDHTWNVDNMLRSIRKSLEYYSEHFGPYKHKQARIIEFPRVASFAQAFPGTMPYSEGIGFIADIQDQDDIDMVFYVVAHEMAHQWWAHQVIGANMQGATLLSETLAQYSALMVMEQEYGRDIMRKFLSYEMDRYLSSRGRERLKERPLAKVESNQGYIHYRKGSAVMYYLKEMIGEQKINRALRGLVEKFGYASAPYPTSLDLIEALREETPDDLQYLIDDLFHQITLFANRTLSATYQQREDGKYDVTIDVQCEKFQADDQGVETEVPVNDWIEIGAFAEPEDGRRYGETLYRDRVKIDAKQQTFTFTVDAVPAKAGIDPFALLIDRLPDDNMRKPKLKKG